MYLRDPSLNDLNICLVPFPHVGDRARKHYLAVLFLKGTVTSAHVPESKLEKFCLNFSNLKCEF